MFFGQMKESRSSTVYLDDDPEAVAEYIKLTTPLTSREVQLTLESVEKLLPFAEKYAIDHLKKECEVFLSRKKNSLHALVIADENNLDQIARDLVKTIKPIIDCDETKAGYIKRLKIPYMQKLNIITRSKLDNLKNQFYTYYGGAPYDGNKVISTIDEAFQSV